MFFSSSTFLGAVLGKIQGGLCRLPGTQRDPSAPAVQNSEENMLLSSLVLKHVQYTSVRCMGMHCSKTLMTHTRHTSGI